MEAEIKLLKPFDWQLDVLRSNARFKVLAVGRRAGKSEYAITDGVRRLLRGQKMWFTSPTNRNNKRVYPQFKRALARIPGVYTNDTDMLVRLPTGAFIQFASLDAPDNLRGEGLDYIYVDEAAYVKKGVYDKVLRPMLATTQGGTCFMSSPNGRNEFWEWTLRGKDELATDWQTWHLPSSVSPLITEAELEAIRKDTPERAYRQEYLAEFLADGGAVFRNLEVCTVDEFSHHRHSPVVIGVDWGRHNDYTVLTAIDINSSQVIDIDRFNQIDWQLQRDRLVAMYDKYNVSQIIAEANSIGEPNIEALQQAGLPVTAFTTTNKSKQQIINQLALAFEQNEIKIPRHDALLGELQAYTVERLPSGNLRYNAPSGMHDDTVMSLALAWYGALQGQSSLRQVR